MNLLGRRLLVFVIAVSVPLGACHSGSPSGLSNMTVIEIVVGQSIASVQLGTARQALAKQAQITGDFGELAGVHFSVAEGKVDDVWIEDLRKTPAGVRVSGRVLAPDVPLEQLKAALGPCTEVTGVKGGLFYNCVAGISIGCDAEGTGQLVQLRLRPR